jgi:putative membrane protein
VHEFTRFNRGLNTGQKRRRLFHKEDIAMKNKLLIFFLSVVLILFSFGCTMRPMDRSMRGWDQMMGHGAYVVFMWLILIIVAVVIVYLIFNRNKNTENPEGSSGESPIEILKTRYAKGEITKEEFERLKRDIEG